MMRFAPAEKSVLTISLVLFLLDGLLLAYKGVSIDVEGYAAALAIGGFSLGLGQFYRSYRRNEGIALATTACGLYIVFTLVASVFNYLLLPNHNPMIDPLLIRIDAALGYSWTNFVIWTAQWPWLGTLFRAVYVSSMAQLILVILILGFAGKRDDLHRFLLTGVLGGIFTICIWAFFPSSGASGWEVLPTAASGAVPIMVNSDYGMELNRLAQEGVTYISPKNVLGLIGFPSFHTVMACLSVWYMSRFKWVFPIFLIINLIMLPSVLVQGGHHLSDVLGGLTVFAVATYLARRILAQSTAKTTLVESQIASVPNPH